MALWIDQKYVNLLSMYLDKFKKIDNGLYNFRCPICGDSQKNKSKCRGYLYTKSQAIFYSCKNCDAGTTLGKFLEHVSSSLAAEYRRELYLDKSEDSPQRSLNDGAESTLVIPKVASRFIKAKPKEITDPFSGKLECLISLAKDHPATQYIRHRKIPDSQLHKLYYIPEIRNISNIPGFRKYEERIKGYEPRIVLPYFNIDGKLTGVTCRAIEDHPLRYVSLKVVEDEPLIFGMLDIDMNKPIFVTEGGFDSMFIENCIAVGGTGMGKLESLGIDRDKLTIIFDNQPRNKVLVNIIDKTIRNGYRVLIWNSRTKGKDINEMVLNGENYLDQIENRCYNGLQAKIEFNQWRK
jgi:hypothetical protein